MSMIPLTITKRYGPIRIVYAYFEAPANPPRCDILRLRQMSSCSHGPGWRCSSFDTLHVDLMQPEEELWRSVHVNTREKIRRAVKRDNLTITRWDDPDPSVLNEFLRIYDQLALKKGISRTNRDSFEQFRRVGALSISKIVHPLHGELAFQAFVVTPKRVRLLISAIERAAVLGEGAAVLGRANRMLFWDNLCHFRNRGMPLFDFGGLYRKGDDPALARIAEFKLGFGGRVVTEYKCTAPLTWQGGLVLALHSGFERLRGRARRAARL